MSSPSHALQDVFECFFSQSSIFATTSAMIYHLQKKNSDAFCQVFIALLNQPVVLGFDSHGFLPFIKDPNIVIPYSMMTKSQLHVLLKAIAEIDDRDMAITTTRMNKSFFSRDSMFEARADPRYVAWTLHCLLNMHISGNTNPEHWQKVAPYLKRRIFASSVICPQVQLEIQAFTMSNSNEQHS